MLEDVIAEIEGKTIEPDKLAPEKNRRFIAGVSMGGGGSLLLAMRNPEKFVAAAALGVGAGTTSETLSPDNIYRNNRIFPERIDIFGSAPIPFNASREEVAANIHLDSAYVSSHNPWDLIENPGVSEVHFFIETGENDMMQFVNPNALERLQELIERFKEYGIPVEGGIVSAASANEPGNGNANHVQPFFRTRVGAVIKFFSEIYTEKQGIGE